MTFRTIPPDSKGYSGLTALLLDNGNELVAMGVGEVVEAMLIWYKAQGQPDHAQIRPA